MDNPVFPSLVQGVIAAVLVASLSDIAAANVTSGCPTGKWVKANTDSLSFRWRLGNRDKTCEIMNPEALTEQGAVVVGCLPGTNGGTYIVEPIAKTFNNCFSFDQNRVSLPARSFVVQEEAPPRRPNPREDAIAASQQKSKQVSGAASSPSTTAQPLSEEERKASALESYRRGDPVSVLLDDLMIENTGIKSSDDIDRYHLCLLSQSSREKSQRQKYYENYRAMIAFANRSFRVPIGLLTCTCGRESRFAADAKNGGATGVCQATGSFLTEVNKWISRPGPIQNEWRSYLESLEGRLESPSCRNLPITKEMIARCPSLGLGTSAIYLRHIFARFEGKRDDQMREEDWARQSVESFAVASGAYNVGVTFADNVLEGVVDRKRWPQELLRKTCQSWLVRSEDPRKRKNELARAEGKFGELKNHLVALRNCLQKDNYLDHQGKPMGGDCGGSAVEKERQVASLQKFRQSLPARCEQGQIRPGPATDSQGRD